MNERLKKLREIGQSVWVDSLSRDDIQNGNLQRITEELSEAEKARLEEIRQASSEQSGYFELQSTRPQTLAYSLADSPVGQLAWIVEKFKE